MRNLEFFFISIVIFLQVELNEGQSNGLSLDEVRYASDQIFLHERIKRSKPTHDKNHTKGKNSTDPQKRAGSPEICRKFKSCGKCGETRDCVWCNNVEVCKHVPMGHLLFTSKECKSKNKFLSGVLLGVCTFDYKVVAITVACVVLVLLILLCCCLVKFCRCVSDFFYYFCCCCCCSKNDSRREERSLKRIEKQMERQARRQELLLKLGLKTDNSPYGSTRGYSKFENTPI